MRIGLRSTDGLPGSRLTRLQRALSTVAVGLSALVLWAFLSAFLAAPL